MIDERYGGKLSHIALRVDNLHYVQLYQQVFWLYLLCASVLIFPYYNSLIVKKFILFRKFLLKALLIVKVEKHLLHVDRYYRYYIKLVPCDFEYGYFKKKWIRFVQTKVCYQYIFMNKLYCCIVKVIHQERISTNRI